MKFKKKIDSERKFEINRFCLDWDISFQFVKLFDKLQAEQSHFPFHFNLFMQ